MAPELGWLDVGEKRRMGRLLAALRAALVALLVTVKRGQTPCRSSQLYVKGIQ